MLFDREGRNVATNASAVGMLGVSRDEASGALVGDPRWAAVRADGSSFSPAEHPAAITGATGAAQTGVLMGIVPPAAPPVWLSVNTRALAEEGDGPPYPVVATFTDVTARRKAELEAAARAEEAERGDGHDAAVLEALFNQTRVGLALLDRDLRFVRVNDVLARINRTPVEAHLGRRMTELFGELGATVERLLARVRDTGQPLVDVEIDGRRPTAPGEPRAYLATYSPVHDRAGRLIGVSAVVNDVSERKRAEAERERLLARERAAGDRATRLGWVTAALAGALTARDVAGVLVREGTGATGMERGWVSLLSADGERLELVESAGYPPEDLERFGFLALDARLPGPDAVRDGRSRFYASADELAAEYAGLAAAYRTSGNEAGAVVPIPGPAGAAGFLATASSARRGFSPEDRELVEAIAGQCGLALDRAAAYEREHLTAETLAQSLLPDELPAIPGVALAARYKPAPGPHAAVGGDFYDVFAVAPERWLLVVGDVCGKGPEAAALTALVRYTLRAEALREAAPERLLTAVNRAILAQRSELRFCTVACARLDLRDDGASVRFASAGHPPPLVLTTDGSARPLALSGNLLGFLETPQLGTCDVELGPGEGFVLHTDGVLEAGAPEHVLTSDELAACLAGHGEHRVGVLADRLHRTAVAGSQALARDDIALVVARLGLR